MSEPTPKRRKRRRIGDPTDISLHSSTELSSPPAENVEPASSDRASSNPPEIPIPPSPTKLTTVDLIRTELLEDVYHAELSEPHFSDDTHNWGNGNKLISDDYWHFLGRFE